LLLQSNEEARNRFNKCRQSILSIGEIIALTAHILNDAASYEKTHDLTPQDALIYASVMSHLQLMQPERACFLNRNSRDFK
jgi:hypothetical protein